MSCSILLLWWHHRTTECSEDDFVWLVPLTDNPGGREKVEKSGPLGGRGGGTINACPDDFLSTSSNMLQGTPTGKSISCFVLLSKDQTQTSETMSAIPLIRGCCVLI